MKLSNSIRVMAATSLALGLTLTVAGAVAGASDAVTPVHALFAETDNATGNSVISYLRGPDGLISYAGTYPTGGLGATAGGAVVDPLASQGALTLINNNTELIATNAGSGTITVFSVHGTRLKVLQQIASGGLFPNSVATSGNLVAVLNAGGAGSVAEFALRGVNLVALPGQVRSLGLTNAATPYFLDAPGQVGYTPNGRDLIVTTKLSTNSFDVFSVSASGDLAPSPVVTAANNAVPFAFNFDAAGNLVVAEAATSSLSTYRVNSDGSLSSLGTVSDGAKALCWISSADGYVFGDNAGSATVSSFSESGAGAPVLVDATAATAHAGTTDSAVSPDGRFLYVESGGAGTIDVYGIGTGGSLSTLETIYSLPLAAEGIAAS